MIRDVFYYGTKPNVHPREKFAVDLSDARTQATTEHFWIVNEYCDYRDFDWDFEFDYLPDDEVWTQYHNNVWPSLHQKDSGTWLCPKEFSDITIYRADVPPLKRRKIDDGRWTIPDTIDKEQFDFTWHHDPTEPPFIYQFATQWQRTGGPIYTVPGAKDVKFVGNIVARRLEDKTNWIIPEGIDTNNFDFSWHPDDMSPPYTYQFGTLVDDIHLEDGPKYVTPGSTGHVVYLETRYQIKYPKYYIKTTLDDLIKDHPNEIFWALRHNIDYSSFNFDWVPEKENVFHINVFGSTESETTQTYLVNGKMIERGFSQRNYVEEGKTLNEEYLSSLFMKPDIFFIDKGNTEANNRFEQLKLAHPKIQKTRYLNSWVDTINRCCAKSTAELFWVLNSELDYTNFNFDYYPNPWQMKMVHVFGTQWSHWGNTFLVNKESFPNDTKYVKIIEHLSNLNFVKKSRAFAPDCVHSVFLIDHMNGELVEVHQKLQRKTNKQVIVVPYIKNYKETFKNILSMLPDKKDQYIWIANSICDYDLFDFTYICDPFTREQLHVFPSDKQKYGDTFLVNVEKMREILDSITDLSDHPKINFNSHLRSNRLPAPTIISGETHVSSFANDFAFPYAVFKTHDNIDVELIDQEPMSLWQDDHKTIKICSTGATQIIAPKEVRHYLKKELYDYPYIVKHHQLKKSISMDVVFMSNGETGAEERYQKLAEALGRAPKRVNGVQGRENAIRKSAEISETDWVFVVPGKLEMNKNFDFDWQPDRMQEPKHYIFYATNPLNKLCYGHMAPVMYNKRLVLETVEYGLDFTMSKKHEIVPINTGTAHYNLDPLMTWRTAFREVIKLRVSNDNESLERLNTWLTVAEGLNGEFSIKGAKDGIEYYDKVQGDPERLQLSFDWAWLNMRFNK